jgi:hypothetical protein
MHGISWRDADKREIPLKLLAWITPRRFLTFYRCCICESRPVGLRWTACCAKCVKASYAD